MGLSDRPKRNFELVKNNYYYYRITPKITAPKTLIFEEKTSNDFNSKKRKKSYFLIEKKFLDFDFSFKKKSLIFRGCYIFGIIRYTKKIYFYKIFVKEYKF